MITIDQIKHIANLSRLEFNEEELESFKNEMSAIVEYVLQLDKVDTSNVEVQNQTVDAKTELRPDEPREYFTPQQATQNAESKKGGCFVVPGVLE